MARQVNITIDGKRIQAPEGMNLLQVARDNGFDIPGLCYHKKLTPTGIRNEKHCIFFCFCISCTPVINL